MIANETINKYNKILIIGHPGSGKSTLFDKLLIHEEEPHHFQIRTDDYKHHEYREQLYIIMDDLDGEDKWIVEGIQGYRLLRKYVETKRNRYKPDLIIMCESTSRPLEDKHKRMAKGLDKILDDYYDLEKDLPEIIHYIN